MLKRILFILLVIIGINSSQAQTYDPFYAGIVANYNYDTVLTYLNEFQALGVKSIGTAALTNAKNWLLDKYASYGYTNVTEQPFSYFGSSTANIIVKKEGCLYPNTYVIVDAHYDSKTGPGTNDNGSGTSIILEMARQLKDVDTKYSILFIHFSGEEDGLIGSQYYVNNTVIPQNLDIKLVFNIDEVGGVSWMNNNTIVCEQDEGSPMGNNVQSSIVTNQLATCVGLYSSLNTEISFAYASDYMPFEDNGEIITGLFEKNETPYAHTVNDVLANMDPVYVHEVGKGATGATLFFAEAYDQTYLTEFSCDAYTSPSGNYVWTLTGQYTDTLLSVAGCDSIINVDLTIGAIDNSVTQSLYTLSATETNADTYQWIDCNNGNAPIPGATNSSYTATVSGNYAVIISRNGCIDTSICTFVFVAGIEELAQSDLTIFPNPASSEFTVLNLVSGYNYDLYLIDMYGKVIRSGVINNADSKFTVEGLSDGIYTVELISESNNVARARLLINH